MFLLSKQKNSDYFYSSISGARDLIPETFTARD